MSHTTTNIDQVEDPNLVFLKNPELDVDQDENLLIGPDPLKKGTNPLLWNAPVYSVIGIDRTNNNIENPNAYLAKIAAEEEAKLNQNVK
jgi:hypothetical protein